ncbi:MAG TPA: hypothetical protein VFK05_18650 [Polyangiaceae bacterium]|nr:hypothetical protein [Polyangiaceae bacterium]
MTSTAGWFLALKRLQRQAFGRSALGERVPIYAHLALVRGRSWRKPELRVSEQEQRVEFVLHVAGASADSTRVYWDEESRTLTVHALAPCQAPPASVEQTAGADDCHWYTVIPVGSDVEGNRAEAFLKSGILRIVAPRVDSKPLTGLPLLVWTAPPTSSALAAST